MQILDGTHPRAESIGAIIEDAHYHERLLEHVREFKAAPASCKPLLRENVLNNPHFAAIAETFGDLPSAIGYFAGLPDRPGAALRRLLRTRKFPHAASGSEDGIEAAANDNNHSVGPRAA